MVRNWAEEIYSKMTIEEKIGQMIWANLREDIAAVKKISGEGHVGATLGLPTDRAWDANGVREWVNEMQELSRYPLFLAGDFEYGVGWQIPYGATEFPSSMAVGATFDSKYAYRFGEVVAKEAGALGFRMVVYPVMDVNNNPDNPIIGIRAFGETPELVSEMGVAYIKGCQKKGMISTAKHFPGHGDVSIDSHRGMPIVSYEMDRLQAVELMPFISAIKAGVKAILPAHIAFPAIDSTLGMPATLSEKILNGFLRMKLGFKGLIVTDAMDMKGITNSFDISEAVVMAARAGIDLLLVKNPQKAFEDLTRAVKDRRLPMERVEESVQRILKIKMELGLHKKRLVNREDIKDIVGTKENLEVAKEIAHASITLVKNDKNLLPLRMDSSKRLVIITLSNYNKKWVYSEWFPSLMDRSGEFIQEVKKRHTNTVEIPLDSGEIEKQVSKVDLIILAAFLKLLPGDPKSALLGKEEIELVRKLIEMNKPLILVSCGNPYLLKEIPRADAYLCSYGDAPVSIEACVKVIFGEASPRGRLPISIPGLYNFGHGEQYGR